MDSKTEKSMRLASDIASEYVSTLENRLIGQKRHLQTPFKALDSGIPGWLHEGHLIIIAGRPAMGKSAFAQQILEFTASQQRTSILFTLEMSSYEIVERTVARRTGISIPRLKTSLDLSSTELSKISKAIEEFSMLPMLIDDASFEIEGLIEKTKKSVLNFSKYNLPPLGCIVVDYLQLVGSKAMNRNMEVGQVTSGLKRLAKELAVPVVALSQLNRSLESRVDKRPLLSDLRESGQIEQDADLVLFLYRDDYYNEKSLDKGIAEVIIAKNRHGNNGILKLGFHKERIMFGDKDHEY
jgi:replicative DNA helicase